MQVFSAEQIRLWDEFTIRNEPISPIDLMERAATRCMEWLAENKYLRSSFSIFCGKGNNGGDGLALARLLSLKDCHVVVYILEFGHKGTVDFQINLARLHLTEVEIRFIQSEESFHKIPKEDVVIDALYGSGLNRPLEGVTARLIEYINANGNEVISIDIPSGMYVDKCSVGNVVIRAAHTLCLQCFKLAFLVAENAPFIGEEHLLDIGLHPAYLQQAQSDFNINFKQYPAHASHEGEVFIQKQFWPCADYRRKFWKDGRCCAGCKGLCTGWFWFADLPHSPVRL